MTFDQNKRKAIKLSKQHCETIKKAENEAWIKCLEKCVKYSWITPKRVTFRQITLENGAMILQEKNHSSYNGWYDVSTLFTEKNLEDSSITYLESEMKYNGFDFWLEKYIMIYERLLISQNKSSYVALNGFIQ